MCPDDAARGGDVEAIEADEALGDYESDAYSTYSSSLASSARDYIYENNRRYHRFKEGSYLLPNDDQEQERENMKHALIIHVMDGKLHYAPLKNPQKVLDLGTGTGAWSIEMGDVFPSAEIIGVDLSPIQPPWVPPNVKFYVDDIETDWIDEPSSVDFVHVRHMAPAVKDWPALVDRAYEAIKPGGWIEMQELCLKAKCDDGTMTDEWPYYQFLVNIKRALGVFGVELLAMEKNKQLLEDGGFAEIQESIQKVPIGPWARDSELKEIGTCNRETVLGSLQAASMSAFTKGLHWSPEEVETFLVSVRKSLFDQNVHAYFSYHVVYAQKPEASGEGEKA